jgi:uncharacterized SAM-binding protein YcdF (DUF218 family)
MSASSTERRSIFRRLRISRRVRRIALIAFGIWLVFACVLGIAVFVYGQTDRAQPADVIIVLGAGLNRNLTPGTGLIRRAERGAELWKAGYAPAIICSGGYARWSTRSEADACAEVLRENGVPADAIILEEQSRSTEENALYSHEIMNARGWTTALVVSEGYHLLRASWIFSAEGINASFSPATEPTPFFNQIYSIAREIVALHWQVFKTVLGLPVRFVPWV